MSTKKPNAPKSQMAGTDTLDRSNTNTKHVVTLCCSPAFAALWLGPRMPKFFDENPDIDINLVTTQNFLSMEPGVRPDIYITKLGKIQAGALESSTVDLTEQLVNMIVAQRNFQANSQMVSTQDQITQTIINLR